MSSVTIVTTLGLRDCAGAAEPGDTRSAGAALGCPCGPPPMWLPPKHPAVPVASRARPRPAATGLGRRRYGDRDRGFVMGSTSLRRIPECLIKAPHQACP